MKRKIALKVLALISMMCAGFLMPEMVFALGQGGAVGGGIASGGSCESSSDLWNTCNGYSWQKYKVTQELPSEGVTMSYTKNTNPEGAVYIGGGYCKTGMTIYNYGFEVKRTSLRGYQVSTQSNREGVGTQANWVYDGDGISGTTPTPLGNLLSGRGDPPFTALASTNFTNGNIQDYTTPVGYATQDEAWKIFDNMKEYIKANPGQAENIPGSDLKWGDVGAFCWYEKGEDIPPPPSGEAKFLANSKAQVSKATGSATPRTAETGISVQDKEVSTTLAIKVGESAKIVFNHNIYASEKVDAPKGWRIERDFSAGITMGAGATPTSGYVKFSNLGTNSLGGKRLYNADKSPIFTETYNNIKFNNQGHYRFCESITVDNTITTRVCVNIDVKKDPLECTGTECECYGTNCPPPQQPQQPCGFAVPGSYSSSSSTSGTTSVISRVRNLSLSNVYGGFQGVIYAKPGDTVNWCNAYYPGVQKAANATVTINNYDPEPTDLSDFTNTLTNGVFSDYSDWTNQFSITSVNVRPYYSESPSFGIGNSDPQSSSNSTSIGTDQVGQTLSETITSGSPATASASSGSGPHTWACHWKEEDERCGIVDYVDCEPYWVDVCVAPNPNGGCFHYVSRKKWKQCPVYGSCYVDTCRHTNLFYGNSHGGTTSDTSYVQVPYNFRNTATVNIRDSLVYAGETMTIGGATVTVGGKQNDATQGFYATRVDNVQTKLVGYLSSSSTGAAKDNLNSSNICSALPVKNGSCNELNSYSGMTLNSGSSNMSGSTSALGFAGQSYNVYDAMAGDYYCVVAAVYPSTSGSDTNLAASGDGRWYVSAPSCRVIAKRPSFQVWGGSIYSARAVKTSNASKNNLWNVSGYGYTTTDTRNTVIFGSWVEQSVVSNGIVTGLASGAATGDVADVRQTGSKESGANYCTYRVPLSIANWSTSTFGGSICPNVQAVGNAGLSNAAIDENSLMDYWNVSNASYINKTTINLASDYIETTTMQGNRVNYTEVAGNIYQASLTGATIRKGITHVVRTSENLRIDGNIMYENATYRSQKEIPKLLIYAGGNIVINCGVSRIDAIIIAGGQVKTCDSSDNNARANSNQLKVNGMIIADKLILNRSYGAWAGTGSGVPAEIINYDTSAIVWGKGMAAKSDFDTLTTVYQHEIAPRY